MKGACIRAPGLKVAVLGQTYAVRTVNWHCLQNQTLDLLGLSPLPLKLPAEMDVFFALWPPVVKLRLMVSAAVKKAKSVEVMTSTIKHC
jgi:hypothetical protein